ncbi:hypothetical protein A374_15609 [Fictibacillus macauensis ZFHKF-1]|uniref:DUF4305 domain-containing protein n=1 Tax=Fictibacillus macauensis ZFHKF-1 TaxID=1196324 RepID=I8UC91_9BACL|nr:hypothetical protein [Fictibacillus macauensis]EIT84408.1 hypothetical protein A374_15609 [Fictibacillus macauensis ZFHKF-1]
MKVSPLFLSGFYGIAGILFTWLAVYYSTYTGMTGFWTIISMLAATYDYSIAIRYYRVHRHIKKYTKK